MIARQHEDVLDPATTQNGEILEHGVGSALIPVFANLLLRRQNIDVFIEAAIKETPAPLKCSIKLCALYCVATPILRIPELTQFDKVKSIIRNLPPKGTAGLLRLFVNCINRLPRPPARTRA
jgi:hypothetical protein